MKALQGIVLLAGIPSSTAVFFKPNPIPSNYVEWTATVYADGDGVSTYKGSSDEDIVFWWESGVQDVWMMYDVTTWKKCDFSYATQLLEPVASGGDYTEGRFALNSLKAGTYYLAAGVGAHCEAGQKIILSIESNPFCNDETGRNAFVGAGAGNMATGDWATIGGGYNNKASGMSSVVLGGISNYCISNYATIAGGFKNQAKSRFATVLGGGKNTARGRFSVAAGYLAKTTQDYSAAFAFNGDEGCSVDTAKTVGFCAEHFYVNDIDILAGFMTSSRRLDSEKREEMAQKSIEDIRQSIDESQAALDQLSPAIELNGHAFDALARIEAKLAAAGIAVGSAGVA
eukprot:INCI19850.1.p1 GENE.INCI19850.1~~INCI19850.1.p1  ORF type:complete len:343 (+),score=71.66 INCI19850.1:177-1205(+)